MEIPEVELDAARNHVRAADKVGTELHRTFPMVEETTIGAGGKPWVVTMIGPSPELLATLGLGETS